MRRLSFFSALILIFLVNAAHDFVMPPLSFGAEVEVTLFGKKCLISGPFTAKELEAVHSISPEKVPPVFTQKQAHDLLDRLAEIHKGSVPSSFDAYLDRLKKRVGAIAAFYDATDAAEAAKATQTFFDKTKAWIGKHDTTELQTAIDKLSKDWSNAAARDQAFDAYQKFIEPDPESEFHRVTKRLKIKYSCNFEEED